MGFFKMGEPRKFNHKYIFVYERKEKLDKIVESAKRDLGMLPSQEGNYRERLQGAFTNDGSHLSKRKENGERISSRVAVGSLFVCVLILYFLLREVFVF